MTICRDCPSQLPPEGPDVHPTCRRVLCDDCKRRVRREAKRRAKGPPKPAPQKRVYVAPVKLPGSRLSRIYQRKRDYVDSLKSGRPCLDCGGSFPPVCMDFDHRPTETKVREISKCKTRAAIDAEVGKCDLVCANCHRLRTEARRLSSLGTASDPSAAA